MKNPEILMIGNSGALMTELYNDLSRYFKVRAVGFDKIQVYKQLHQKLPDCIVINLKETTKEQLEILKLLKADTQWRYLKIIVIGFKYECNLLNDTMQILIDKMLIYPISKDNMIKEICELCGIANLIEEQNGIGGSVVSASKLKHVLVVDDDARMLRAVKSWLQDIYEVSIVNSGAAALLFLEKQIPDVILLDYEMPVCNGPHTLELIRKEERYKNIPVFFLTGVSDKEKVKNVVNLNPQGYILKGITRKELIRKLNEFFALNM